MKRDAIRQPHSRKYFCKLIKVYFKFYAYTIYEKYHDKHIENKENLCNINTTIVYLKSYI